MSDGGSVAPAGGKGSPPRLPRAALRFGLIERGLERIVSIAQIGNHASERIMNKLGMTLERDTADPTCRRPARVHAITKTKYIPGSPRR